MHLFNVFWTVTKTEKKDNYKILHATCAGEGGWSGGGRQEQGPGGHTEGGGQAQGQHSDTHQVRKAVTKKRLNLDIVKY